MAGPQRRIPRSLYGPRYRYFTDDPEGKGRGPGYYRVFRGMYFKKEGSGARRGRPAS